VYPIHSLSDFQDPNLVKAVLAEDNSALYFSRAPVPFDREAAPPPPLGWGHLGVYAYRRDALRRFVSLPPSALEKREKLEQLRALAHGLRIVCLPLAEQPAKGIDTPADYAAFVARWRQRAKG
ncbi:MAG: 3-deoxy-manno-octulosonate cytidylyltransferase, partial [Planctomycetota bacterium]|nr:3-deoxy-manno-octulosonate cytidylyltransferase [Planctomycetota bacterium]